MKKLALFAAISAATLLGAVQANAGDQSAMERAGKAQARTIGGAAQSTDISSRGRYYHYGHARYHHRRHYGYYRPYYNSYGYAPAPYYYGGGPVVTFGFGGGGYRGWHHHRGW